jgi:hypothetical protein
VLHEKKIKNKKKEEEEFFLSVEPDSVQSINHQLKQ